jgi:hypothetical protein
MAVLFLVLLVAFITLVILVLTVFQAAVSQAPPDSRRTSSSEAEQRAADAKFLREIGIRSD